MSTSGRLWPWALGGVLALTMAGNLWVMRLAGADASFAVEPDYYRKAVTWDSAMAQRTRNEALGWTLEATLAHPDPGGAAMLVATLHDAAGMAIGDATIRVEATHNARASQILAAVLRPAGGGSYRTTVPAIRRGIWELRFEVERQGVRFTTTLRRDTSWDRPAP